MRPHPLLLFGAALCAVDALLLLLAGRYGDASGWVVLMLAAWFLGREG